MTGRGRDKRGGRDLEEIAGATGSENRTHSCHETVSTSTLLVLKDDVRIVVGNKVFESRIVSGDFAFFEAGCRNGVLADVGDVLLEDEWRQFARTAAPIATTTWSAGQDDGQEDEDGSDGDERRPPMRADHDDGRMRMSEVHMRTQRVGLSGGGVRGGRGVDCAGGLYRPVPLPYLFLSNFSLASPFRGACVDMAAQQSAHRLLGARPLLRTGS